MPVRQQPASPEAALERAARRAYDEGDWAAARERYQALAARTNAPEAWEGLGQAAWCLQDTTGMLDARMCAYRLYRERDDAVAAARLATALGNDFLDFRGDAAVANGWFQRARRLLEPLPPASEHAMLRAWEARLALIGRQDAEQGARLAEDALALARSCTCPDAEALALAMRGLALVMAARPREGLSLLDEAAAAALGGDISDPYAAGLACCYLISACDRIRDYERAMQWCARLREFLTRQRFAILFTTCRLQYGSILTSRGAYDEAEAELGAAIEDLRANRPVVLPAAFARMGELRRRQGRASEAAELFERAGSHPLALLGAAWMDLERGAPDAAADRVQAYLRRFPGDARLERAPANEILVRVASAAGRLDDARAALAELEAAAEEHERLGLRGAALAAGAVIASAEGEAARAVALLEDATALYEEAALPYEAACARDALAALRTPQAAARPEPARVERSDNGPLTSRELDVLRLVARGLGERELADSLGISPHTAHRHLSNIRLKLGAGTQAAAVARALRDGLL